MVAGFAFSPVMWCGENPHEHPDPRGPQRQEHAVLGHSGLYA